MGDLKFDFERITKKKEFDNIYETGCKFVSDYFVVFFKKNNDLSKKVAVVASKKIGKAVLRNRAKRRMREVIRLSKSYIKDGTSIIMVARKSLLNVKFSILMDTFINVINKFYTYTYENNQ